MCIYELRLTTFFAYPQILYLSKTEKKTKIKWTFLLAHQKGVANAMPCHAISFIITNLML